MARKPAGVPSVPIDGVFAPKTKPKDDRIWQEVLRDTGNEWSDYLLGPHKQSVVDLLSFLPSQSIVDAIGGSGEVSSGVKNQNPWEAGMGLIDMLTAGLPGPNVSDVAPAALLAGILPKKSTAKEFDLIHGSYNDILPEPNAPHGKFNLKYALTGEKTNYEGKGIYGTDPKAVPVAEHYTTLGPDEAQFKITDPSGAKYPTTIAKMKEEVKSKEGLAGANTADKMFALDNLEKMLHFRSKPGVQVELGPLVNEILQAFPEEGDDFANTLNYFKNQKGLVQEPGGWIYDFKVHDSPENFINMHLPIQYQDDKIIKAVDEWIKHMPISNDQLYDYIFVDGKRTEQAVRDKLRRDLIDDEYRIPKKIMSELLQNEYINEHMDIIKDQGILGQKWFANFGPGRASRDKVRTLFENLAVVDNSEVPGFPGHTRDTILKDIKDLEDQMNNMPLTDNAVPKLLEIQNKINELNNRLENAMSPDDIQETLGRIYKNPGLKYNYTINNTDKTTITGRKFIPK